MAEPVDPSGEGVGIGLRRASGIVERGADQRRRSRNSHAPDIRAHLTNPVSIPCIDRIEIEDDSDAVVPRKCGQIEPHALLSEHAQESWPVRSNCRGDPSLEPRVVDPSAPTCGHARLEVVRVDNRLCRRAACQWQQEKEQYHRCHHSVHIDHLPPVILNLQSPS